MQFPFLAVVLQEQAHHLNTMPLRVNIKNFNILFDFKQYAKQMRYDMLIFLPSKWRNKCSRLESYTLEEVY